MRDIKLGYMTSRSHYQSPCVLPAGTLHVQHRAQALCHRSHAQAEDAHSQPRPLTATRTTHAMPYKRNEAQLCDTTERCYSYTSPTRLRTTIALYYCG